MRKSVIILAALVLLAAACAPQQGTEQVQSDIGTAVALTVGAQQEIGTSVALTVAAQIPATATFTPTLVNVPSATPVIPTVTPLTLTQPSSGGSGSGGGVRPKPEYACDVIHARPFDNTEFNPGDKFDIKWTILNTGTRTWPAGYDLKYFSGPNMTAGGTTILELPEMKPGDQYSVVFDAVAPAGKGFQVMTWMVQGQLCWPYTAIVVK